ncbi:MAG: low-specificity L-threonine aldolase [Firmicutes bacterium]|nr:low-specificity L-threonine aldolase [Bacillota bacterium]
MMRIDLRSDTVTQPTPAMRTAMARARVGDDVFGEDPTVRELEELGAAMIGKEAALFVASGTMGNQVAVMTHASRGDEVIVEAEAHIYYYEVGALAVLAGVQARPVVGERGYIPPERISAAIRPESINFPRTALLCLENTHNRAGGAVITPRQMRAMAEVAHARGIPVHLDGARIFNAAVALGVTAAELAAPADSVMFCLSKGLCAPVGSLLAGSREFIARARKCRKMLGGGMRQAGILAAAGIVALREMVERLAEDHAKARRLAEGLAAIRGIAIDPAGVETNIVLFSVAPLGVGSEDFLARLAARGVLGTSFGEDTVRFVTHHDVDASQIDLALRAVAEVVRELGKKR